MSAQRRFFSLLKADITPFTSCLEALWQSIGLFTLSEGGEVNELHVGLKGTMNALYLKDLAQKVHRGIEGRVRDGRSGGGLCYGYDVIREYDSHGERIRGGRTISGAEAAVVLRIFTEFATGISPRQIAIDLNEQNIPGPNGAEWGPSTINGNAARGTGILNNELYMGRLVWNRLHYLNNPETGRRVSRLNDPRALVVHEVPELRIVPQDLWDRVKARQRAIARDTRSQAPRQFGGDLSGPTMPNIRSADMLVIDDLFDMGAGYVLDFSDRTFAQFFADELNIDIDDPLYAKNGTSKAKRLRCFLQTIDKPTVARTLHALWERREILRQRAGREETILNSHGQLLSIINRLAGGPASERSSPKSAAAFDRAIYAQLLTALMDLTKLEPQPRGYAFETFLKALFDRFGLEHREPFRLRGEQIDGSFLLGNEIYLLEAKWQNAPSGIEHLHTFHRYGPHLQRSIFEG